MATSAISKKPSFTEDAAEKIGIAERTIRGSIQRSTDIIPEVKAKLKELDLTKKGIAQAIGMNEKLGNVNGIMPFTSKPFTAETRKALLRDGRCFCIR